MTLATITKDLGNEKARSTKLEREAKDAFDDGYYCYQRGSTRSVTMVRT